MSAAQHTPSVSLKELAEAAQMMPWDRSESDVPHAARYAFRQAITANHYLDLLAALEELLHNSSSGYSGEPEMDADFERRYRAASERALAVIAKATGQKEPAA